MASKPVVVDFTSISIYQTLFEFNDESLESILMDETKLQMLITQLNTRDAHGRSTLQLVILEIYFVNMHKVI